MLVLYWASRVKIYINFALPLFLKISLDHHHSLTEDPRKRFISTPELFSVCYASHRLFVTPLPGSDHVLTINNSHNFTAKVFQNQLSGVYHFTLILLHEKKLLRYFINVVRAPSVTSSLHGGLECTEQQPVQPRPHWPGHQTHTRPRLQWSPAHNASETRVSVNFSH